MATSKIFISYRREDSSAYAGRLCDHLTWLLGDGSVFMDVDDIRPGENFAQTIDHWIDDCNTVLVVVGPAWLESLQRRLKETEPDYVVHEIEEAFRRKRTVVPVLVGGARIDELNGLPATLAELSFRQAAELRDQSFREDCDRLAKDLGLPNKSAPPNRARIWAAALVGVILLFLIANWAGIGPWQAYRKRTEQIHQQLQTAETQTKLGEYESAFNTYQDILQLDSANRIAKNGQVEAAMLWAEHFHALIGESQKAEDVAGPPLAKILSVLYAGLARTDGHDTRAADILAHLGWTHWLNEHIAYKEFGQSAEQGLRQALSIDPANVYANAMLGNWMLQKNKDFREALKHFEVAVKTTEQRPSVLPMVRQMQLGGLLSTDEAGVRAELTKVANHMRLNHESLPNFYRTRILRNYSPGSGFRDGELEQTLSAVPSSDSWATFLWLDSVPETGGSAETQKIVREIVKACLAGIDGKREEALALLKPLRSELKKKNYYGSIADEVDFLIKRFNSKSAALVSLRETRAAS